MSLLTALKVIIEFLETNKIPYMVIGGIANSIYGEPRQTFDIDIKIKINEQISLVELLERLSKISESIHQNPVNFANEMRVFPINIEGTKIDLIFADLNFEKEAIDNSVRYNYDSIEINVCRPEDLIIQKCVSEREKDWSDIKNIIKININNLNKDYIMKHCKELSDWLSKPDILEKIKKYLNG
jgi:predicted nucleotidyltransferase